MSVQLYNLAPALELMGVGLLVAGLPLAWFGRKHRHAGSAQRLQTPRMACMAVLAPKPRKRQTCHEQAHAHQFQGGCQVVELHRHAIQRPAWSHELEARSKRSRSRLTLEAFSTSIWGGMRIIQLPIGSTRYRWSCSC